MSGGELFAEYQPTAHGHVWIHDVRLARVGDVDAVTALSVARDGGDPAAKVERLRARVDSADSALYVGTVGGDVVGYALIRELQFPENTAPDGLYLGGVVIDPAWRRQGLAYALTAARLTWARERSDVVWYFASAQNRASLDLHDYFGFEEYTRDFEIPGVTFTGGVGILFRLGF